MEFQSIPLLDALATQVYAYLPKLGLGLLVLLAGVAAGKLAGSFTTRLLIRLGLDRAAQTTGLSEVAKQIGFAPSFSEIIGLLAKYILYLLALMLAFDIFGIYALTNVLTTTFSYLPKVIGAVAILVLGFIIAGALAEIVGRGIKGAGVDKVAAGVGIKTSLGDTAESAVRYFLYIIVLLISLRTLEVSSDILNWLFTIGVAAALFAGAAILVISAKDIAPNVAAGVFIDSNKTLKTGQKIKFRQYSGTVESIGITHTAIKTKGGLVQVPNYLLMKEELVS